MKLTAKLILSLLLAVVLLLSLDSYIRVWRAMGFLRERAGRKNIALGQAIRPLLKTAWDAKGEEHAMVLIEAANAGEHPVQIRWVWLDAVTGDPHHPTVPIDQVHLSTPDSYAAITWQDAEGEEHLLHYFRLDVSADRSGAIELKEALRPLNEYVRSLMWEEVALGAAVLLVSAVAVAVLGVMWVGRPLRDLVEKTKQVARGEFTVPVRVRGKDELGELGAALNSMGDDLARTTERVQAETAGRIAALDQLRHADRLVTIGRLASGVAHELGTPLNVITGRAGQIARAPQDPDVSACADIIRGQADRMTRLVRQLLSFARPRKPARSRTDLRSLIDQAVELLVPLARKKDAGIRWNRPDEPRIIIVDGAMIQQVITNLVDNAIAASDKGGMVELDLAIGTHQPPADLGQPAGQYARLSVRDEGSGIPEEHLAHIFDPFFTTKDVGEGTGLGLSISYGIAREHGGWIDVSSRPGQGSCFSVYLPAEEPT